MAAKPVYNEAPFPEIRRLRAAVLQANEKWAAAKLKAHLDAKSRRKACGVSS